MRDTVKIDWRVPTAAWEAFREHVREECGSLDGYLGYEAERAMREYADKDGGSRVEELVDQLVRAAGRTPEVVYKQKTQSFSGEETTRVTARVDRSVKEAFKAEVDKSDTTDTYGTALARALSVYRDGGRFGRLTRRLERVVDDAKSILAELADADAEDSTNTVRRRTSVIAARLGDQFTDDELRDEIADVAGESDPTIRRYRARVVEHKNVEPHPGNPDLWVPESVAANFADDGTPRECRQPVELLDRDDRAQRIKYEVGRQAATRDSGCVRVTVADIQEDALNDEVSKSSVRDLLNTVETTDGYTFDTSGTSAKLNVNLSVVSESDPELLARIVAYRDGDPSRTAASPSSPETTTATGSSPTDSVDEEWGRLEAATDGGWSTPAETSTGDGGP